MAIFNLGSVNVDHFYDVPHLPVAGETLAANGYATGLGGKGANQSVAAALAGATVVHIGCIGPDSDLLLKKLRSFGVDCTHLAQIETPTAHAIINIDPHGENAIVIYPGANEKQSLTRLETALSGAVAGDILLLQNETNLTVEAAKIAQTGNMRVIYSAAPFDADAVKRILPHIDMLVMNEGEAAQLEFALGQIALPERLITHGAKGAVWYGQNHQTHEQPAFSATPIDTTGAGDCFIGNLAAGLDQGLKIPDAMRRAAAASAVQVTRKGTADAMPSAGEVDKFLS